MKKREVRYLVVVSPKGMAKVSRMLDLAQGFGLRLGRVCTSSLSTQVPVSFTMSVETGSCVMEILGLCEKAPEAFLKEINSLDLIHGAPLSYDKITVSSFAIRILYNTSRKINVIVYIRCFDMVILSRSHLKCIEDNKVTARGSSPTFTSHTQSFLGEVNQGIDIPSNSTLCLVKPHMLKNKKLSSLLDSISEEGFKITALSAVHMTVSMAEELFEDYR